MSKVKTVRDNANHHKIDHTAQHQDMSRCEVCGFVLNSPLLSLPEVGATKKMYPGTEAIRTALPVPRQILKKVAVENRITQ